VRKFSLLRTVRDTVFYILTKTTQVCMLPAGSLPCRALLTLQYLSMALSMMWADTCLMSTVSPTLPLPLPRSCVPAEFCMLSCTVRCVFCMHCWAAHEEGGQTILVVNFGPLPGTRTAQHEEAIMVLGLGRTTLPTRIRCVGY
jgi:hypothetical protein